MNQIRIPQEVAQLAQPGSPIPLHALPTLHEVEILPLPLNPAQLADINKLLEYAKFAPLDALQKDAIFRLHSTCTVAVGSHQIADAGPAIGNGNGNGVHGQEMAGDQVIGIAAVLQQLALMRQEMQGNHVALTARLDILDEGQAATNDRLTNIEQRFDDLEEQVASLTREARVTAAVRNEMLTGAGRPLEPVPCLPGHQLPAAFVGIQALGSDAWRELTMPVLDAVLAAYGAAPPGGTKEVKLRALWVILGGVRMRHG